MRKRRGGEYICDCSAYPFPHRFGGGRCKGFWVVTQQWENNYGGGDCQHCNNLNEAVCEVYVGQEAIKECPVFQEFIHYNEIKI